MSPPSSSSWPLHAIACAIVALTSAAHAQDQTSLAAAPPSTVVITGNPLGSTDIATPSTVLSGEGLVLRRGSSLGETLDGLPGVSSSYFGPNANRPVIRGQDGDRIRVLSNAGASLDASSLSFDHAVPIDPLVVERIEVLRGPAALLYGGSAVGGVVNTIDNRIPRQRLDIVSGAAEARLGGAANERGASGLVEGGSDRFALHADAFWRHTDDLRVPEFDRPLEGGGTERRDRVVNSASQAKGGALGGSWVWDHGYLGASVDSYRNDYGTVAEDDVTIRMKRDRVALAGEARQLGSVITRVSAQVAHTDYQHQEVEGSGEIGITFKNKGTDSRIEAEHAAVALGGGQLRGIFGAQTEDARFSALGEEAFVPSTKTASRAAFVMEEWSFGGKGAGGGSLSAGLRAEHARIDSAGDADAADAKFGPAQSRSFATRSAALGAVYHLDASWQLSGNLAHTERAPTFYELFANGVHVATGTFERGSADQSKERSNNLDVALEWKQGAHHARIGAYTSRFANYIALIPTGEPDFVDAAGESFPVYAFTPVRARFSGIELEGGWRALEGPRTLDLDGKLDSTRATNLDSGEPLPRIAPLRATLGATLAQGPWSARAEVEHAARQSRVPADDTATGAYTLVNLSASYKLKLGGNEGLLFAKLTNVGNTLAYNASTIATVRALSPLPGRGLMAGLHVTF